jgi:hypothetical protein
MLINHLINSVQHNPFEADNALSWSEVSPSFMESNGSLLCPQKPTKLPIVRQINPVHILQPYSRWQDPF